MSSHIISIVRRLEYGYMVYKPFLANRKLEGFYCSMTPQVTGQPSMFPRTSSWNALNKPMTTANRHQSPTLLHKQLNTPGITLPRNKSLHQKHKHEIQNGSGMVRSCPVNTCSLFHLRSVASDELLKSERMKHRQRADLSLFVPIWFDLIEFVKCCHALSCLFPRFFPYLPLNNYTVKSAVNRFQTSPERNTLYQHVPTIYQPCNCNNFDITLLSVWRQRTSPCSHSSDICQLVSCELKAIVLGNYAAFQQSQHEQLYLLQHTACYWRLSRFTAATRMIRMSKYWENCDVLNISKQF